MTPAFRPCRFQYMAASLWVKICGVTDEADAAQAAELGADAIGLNFYQESPRYITAEKAQSIINCLSPPVEPVGIFVSGKFPVHLELISQLSLRKIQLHWPAEASILANPFVSVIPVFAVGERDDLVRITKYLKNCRRWGADFPSDAAELVTWLKKPRKGKGKLPAAILVDARVPGQIGGTGKTVPWELLADFHPEVPLILAGGLTSENVAEAVRIVRPYGVDVASGVEKSPGRKDPDKMKRFIENAREAAERLS